MSADRKAIGNWMAAVENAALAASRLPGASLEAQFWPLDDIMCAFDGCGSKELADRWTELYDACKAADPTFIPRRDKMRGLT